MSRDAEIAALLDRAAIAEVVGPRYGRAMDWLDLAALQSCFHADATLDYGYFQGRAHDWAAMRCGSPEPGLLHRFHYLFPPSIALDGDRARSEGNSIAGVRQRDGEAVKTTYFGARYFDDVEKRDGVWRMSRRVVRVEFVETSEGGAASGMFAKLAMLEGASTAHPLYRDFGVR